jgi:hypothetical protein
MLSKKSVFAVLTLSVLFLSFHGYVIDHIIEPQPQILQLIAYSSIPVAGGLIMLSFCSLLGTFSVAQNSATSHVLGRVSEGPGRNFFLGFFITAYLILARPPLASGVPFLPYAEWVVIVLAVYVVYSTTRLSTDEFYVASESPSWKRHIQDIRREAGRDLVRVTSVMEQFVDLGTKEPLLIYLTLHLQRLGETAEDILKILGPLIDYQKDTSRHKLYFLVFPWTKRKIAIRNKKARGVLLNTLFEKIDGL